MLGVRIIGALMLERRGDFTESDMSDSDSDSDSDDDDKSSKKIPSTESQKRRASYVDAVFHGMAKMLASFPMSAVMESALFDVLRGKKAEFKVGKQFRVLGLGE